MARRPKSLKQTLVFKLAPALALFAVAICLAAYGVASHFSHRVLDEWLRDSAVSLLQQVRIENGRAAIHLSQEALGILEWDAVDRIYFEVDSAQQGRIVGNERLPRPATEPTAGGRPVYYDATIKDDAVRAIALAKVAANGDTITVRVAETRHKRGSLAQEVLASSLLMSLFVVVIPALVFWRGIGTAIGILEDAVRRIRAQHRRLPLSPVEESAVPREVRPLVTEINQLVAELSASLSAQQRFVADAAHQLRTPLASLRVHLELASREPDPGRQKEIVGKALDLVANTARLLQQMLLLAKTEEGAIKLRPDEVADIAALVREEVERRCEDIWNVGGEISYEGSSDALHVAGNPALLREAVANLIDNALRYAPGANIKAGIVRDPPEIFVEDDGPGIPAAERAKVRKRFYRIPGTASDGCGLGLAIVDEIAKRHHARFELDEGDGGRGVKARILFGGDSAGAPPAAPVARLPA